MEVYIVDPTKCEIRSVIRFLHAKGTPPVDIHRRHTSLSPIDRGVWRQVYVHIQHVQKWYGEFRAGRKEVHDKERSGRRPVSEAVIKMVQREVLENRRITVREFVARIPGSYYGTVERSLT
ncbi:HTH_48 domain-containing protein [Nephila pilipes]|uniref:HTH_48 domain-containing protein n=1 Tax=Nephila pilipes TaxID=299642 RepID=A0A8X6INU0_NEPPI|nr:HTH_48 domain-containing protein [Nephila pilipes]